MNNLILSGSIPSNIRPLVFFLILFAAFGILVLAIILVKKFVKPLQIKKDIDEEASIEEELDRVLVPIEDEEIKKQMEEDAKNNEQ